MRKLKLYVATSVDGKIAGPNEELDWLPEPDDPKQDYGYYDFYASIDTTIMGYKTYKIGNSFGDWPYKDKTSFVFSRTADKQVVKEATLINQNPVEFVKELKQKDGGGIWLVGGGEIVKLLHNEGLIDEYIITLIPVILGEGIELFPNIKQKLELTLTQHKVYDGGIVSLHYSKKEGTAK